MLRQHRTTMSQQTTSQGPLHDTQQATSAGQLLVAATVRLADAGVEEAHSHAAILLGKVMGLPHYEVGLNRHRPVEAAEAALYSSFVERRAAGEPLQYIEGSVSFMGCEIAVDARALIPRPETEFLADHIISGWRACDLQGKRLLDLCTGSGCLAVALKKHAPALTVTAVDISAEALALARHNADLNGVVVDWREGDLCGAVVGCCFDFVVCNPPYVVSADIASLQREVRDHEPHLALDGGVDGLAFYRALAQSLPKIVATGGLVWLEAGCGQGSAIMELFASTLWRRRSLLRDLRGIERFICLVKE